MRRQHLVIMVKAPQAGRVKTRLASKIGTAEAVRCYRVLLERTVRLLARDNRWLTWLAVTPDGAAGQIAAWGRGIAALAVRPQGQGGLGVRMQRLMNGLPPGPVVVVGSDIPGIAPGDIAAAFGALGAGDAVFGPAEDGGYWLVGQRRTPGTLQMFDGVRWSSPHTLADTLGNLRTRKVAHLRTIADVDSEADYLRWRKGNQMCLPPLSWPGMTGHPPASDPGSGLRPVRDDTGGARDVSSRPSER
jgi:hypothetical protein